MAELRGAVMDVATDAVTDEPRAAGTILIPDEIIRIFGLGVGRTWELWKCNLDVKFFLAISKLRGGFYVTAPIFSKVRRLFQLGRWDRWTAAATYCLYSTIQAFLCYIFEWQNPSPPFIKPSRGYKQQTRLRWTQLTGSTWDLFSWITLSVTLNNLATAKLKDQDMPNQPTVIPFHSNNYDREDHLGDA